MDPKTFGAFIQSQRKALGLTQADLAEMLHVTDKAVSRWERGVGFPEVTLMEPLAKALEISLLELMQSRKMEADTLSTGEAEAVVAGALEIAQKEQRDIRLTPLWWMFYIPICAVMCFYIIVINKYVEVPWIRGVGHYLAVTCAQLGMTAASTLLEKRRDPSRPVFRHSWQEYAMSAVFYIGGLIWVLSLFLPEMPGLLRYAGYLMLAAYPIYLLMFRPRPDSEE